MSVMDRWIQKGYSLWFQAWQKYSYSHCFKFQYLRPCDFCLICLIKCSHRPFIPAKGGTWKIRVSYYNDLHYPSSHRKAGKRMRKVLRYIASRANDIFISSQMYSKLSNEQRNIHNSSKWSETSMCMLIILFSYPMSSIQAFSFPCFLYLETEKPFKGVYSSPVNEFTIIVFRPEKNQHFFKLL